MSTSDKYYQLELLLYAAAATVYVTQHGKSKRVSKVKPIYMDPTGRQGTVLQYLCIRTWGTSHHIRSTNTARAPTLQQQLLYQMLVIVYGPFQLRTFKCHIVIMFKMPGFKNAFTGQKTLFEVNKIL